MTVVPTPKSTDGSLSNSAMEGKWIEHKSDRNKIRGGTLVKCIAEIRDNKTGEIREYDTVEVLNDGQDYPSVFNWEENNFSCDCNRYLFFKYAGGEEAEVSDEEITVCSEGGYSVNLKNKKDGKVYYREFGE